MLQLLFAEKLGTGAKYVNITEFSKLVNDFGVL